VTRIHPIVTTPHTPVPDLETAWRQFGDRLRVWLERRVRQPADAEDVLQQVFLKMAAAPPIDVPVERLGAWLFRVARNALIDFRRRAQVRNTEPLDPEAPSHEEAAPGKRSLVRCLEPMLQTLPAPYAAAVREADLLGRTQVEIASELGLSHSALKSRVQRGRKMLHDNLVSCCRPDEDLNCDGCDDDAPCAP
jgi:RNA polymerase sigma-70 factor (ECF subfamily)